VKLTKRQLRRMIRESQDDTYLIKNWDRELDSEEKAYFNNLSSNMQEYLAKIAVESEVPVTLSKIITINKIFSLLDSEDEATFNHGMSLLDLAAPQEFDTVVYRYFGFSMSIDIDDRLIKYFLQEYDPGSESHPEMWNLATRVLADQQVRHQYSSFPGDDTARGALGSMLQGVVGDGQAGEALRNLKVIFIQHALGGGEGSERIAAAIYTYGITGEIPDWLIEDS